MQRNGRVGTLQALFNKRNNFNHEKNEKNESQMDMQDESPLDRARDISIRSHPN
jgi:hypothetical protein